MNIARKRAQHRKEGIKYFYPHFMEEDIKFFGPDNFKSLEDALKSADRIIIQMAHECGFYKKDILNTAVDSVKGRITEYYRKELINYDQEGEGKETDNESCGPDDDRRKNE